MDATPLRADSSAHAADMNIDLSGDELSFFKIAANYKEEDPLDIQSYFNGEVEISNAVFCEKQYKLINKDLKNSDIPPLYHFCKYGYKENRKFNIYFDEKKFIIKKEISLLSIIKTLSNTSDHALMAYLDKAKQQNDKKVITILEDLHNNVNYCTLFDQEYYESQLTEPLDGLSSLAHHILIGQQQGLSPHPLFDLKYYLYDQPDYKPGTGIALIDFYQQDNDDHRSPSPFIDLLFMRHYASINGIAFQDYASLLCLAMQENNIPPAKKVNNLIIASTQNCSFDWSLYKNIIVQTHDKTEKKKKLKTTLNTTAIILHYNNPILVIISCYHLTEGFSQPFDIHVVDNSSEPFHVEILHRNLSHLPGIKITRLDAARSFGEANNIGFDYTDTKYSLFLNDDCFIKREDIRKNIAALKASKSDAIAPVIITQDGDISEFGGKISDCGQIIQVAKFLNYNAYKSQLEKIEEPIRVDYISAACMLIKTDVFRSSGGFDYIFEPFYYEDTDLCRRLKNENFVVSVNPKTVAVHIENSSTKERFQDDFMPLIQRQKNKFSNRWFLNDNPSLRYRLHDRHTVLNQSDKDLGYSKKKLCFVYTPFDLRIGGGERYILSIAQSLSEEYEVWFLTPHYTSKLRFLQVMDDLNIPETTIHISDLNSISRKVTPDLLIAMGNHLTPPIPGMARKNVYHCQFPFPEYHRDELSHDNIRDYDLVMVNSEFTKRHYTDQLLKYNFPGIKTHVVYPPIKLCAGGEPSRKASKPSLLNVGRFIAHGHNKRQDIVLEIAKTAMQQNIIESADIIGGLSTAEDDNAFYQSIYQQSQAYDGITVAANLDKDRLHQAYLKNSVYIHACGYGLVDSISPECCEHFGITLVEAMSYGCIPLVYDAGGPAEIIRDTNCGFLYRDQNEAVAQLRQIAAMSKEERETLARQCQSSSQKYSEATFKESVTEAIQLI